MLSHIRGERIQAVLLLVVAVIYLMGTRSLPAGRGEPGPAAFPIVLGVLLILLAFQLFREGGRARGAKKASAGDGEEKPRPLAYPLVGIALTIGFAALFPVLGFRITTWIYAFAMTTLYLGDIAGSAGWRRWLQMLAIPTLAVVLVHLLFVTALGVSLPGPVWAD